MPAAPLAGDLRHDVSQADLEADAVYLAPCRPAMIYGVPLEGFLLCAGLWGGALIMFESGAACNFQVQYLRSRRALPITRDYMAEAEGRYRAFSSASKAGAG